MKKAIFTILTCIISVSLFAQTYKLAAVYKDKTSETYLSHWKVIENRNTSAADTFSLWGYQRYYDDWVNGAYEVEYFKGSAKDVYSFLNQVIAFTEKYREEDKVMTNISGVRVKTLVQLGFKLTLVYDKKCKVPCMFKLNQWSDMLSKFTAYCADNGINYK